MKIKDLDKLNVNKFLTPKQYGKTIRKTVDTTRKELRRIIARLSRLELLTTAPMIKNARNNLLDAMLELNK